MSPSWSSAGGLMSLHHVQVGLRHGHLCMAVSTAWDASYHSLPASALGCWSGCSQDRGLAARRGSCGDVWGRGCWAGVAWGAPGGLPCCNHVLCQIGLTFPQKCVAPAPDAGLSPAQPCRSGAVEVTRRRETC